MLHKPLARREFLKAGGAGLAIGANPSFAASAGAAIQGPLRREPTRFQIACMTLVYAAFSLERALRGIRDAGYRYVAWGVNHREGGKDVPVLAADATPAQARQLGQRCRDMGLEPVMMFSTVYPEHKTGLQVLRNRILQASAAKVPQVLTFGHTRGGNARLWIERFRELGPIARENGVTIVVKQHGGETGTGAACGMIIREVNDEGIKLNYDAGNVMDYLEGRVHPLDDLNVCARDVRSFCIKDHRFFPAPHQDCGPGFGEVDHYRLLDQVAWTGRTIPLCCENVFAPHVRRPVSPDGVDSLACRAREYLEFVVQAIQASSK